MSSSQQYKTLMEKALSCLHMARAINDRYDDPSKMPAEEAANRKALTKEGMRLKELADIQLEQDRLEGWAAAPADEHPALKAMADAQHTKADVDEAVAATRAKSEVKAFFNWMRGKALSSEEKAALVEDATGEVLVPHDITGPIFKTLPHRSVFRSSGPTIRRTTSNKVDVRSLTNATAAWQKLEVIASPTPQDANVAPNTPADVITVWDLIALSKVGVDELADTDANLTALIQQIVSLQFGQIEDDAFANGNGTSQPWGLAMRATQATPLITQGVTAGTVGITGDNLKALIYSVPTVYRQNGAFYAADTAAAAIALLKDTTGNYLWQPSIRADEPDSLFGKRFYTLEGLPAYAAGTAALEPSVIFGDPELGYMVADRQDVTMQRLDERYAELGQVGFLFKKRVGGDVIRPAAFAKYLT